MNKILLTGAAGMIGRVVRQGLAGRYQLLRLNDIQPLGAAAPGEELVPGNLQDFAFVRELVRGVDTIVHLGGQSREGPWEGALHNGIAVAYNVFEAARLAGVRRIVYASSNHAVGLYPAAERISVTEVPKPDSRYGVAKVFGEMLGSLYATKHGVSVACLRIGSFRARPEIPRQLATWISHRDMVQLVTRCIDAPAFDYLIAYGVSANTRSAWDNPAAGFLGYVPEDNAEAFAHEFAGQEDAPASLEAQYHGGQYAAAEWTIPPPGRAATPR